MSYPLALLSTNPDDHAVLLRVRKEWRAFVGKVNQVNKDIAANGQNDVWRIKFSVLCMKSQDDYCL